MTTMTGTQPPADRDSSRYCGGPLRHRDGTCTRPAGWGTPHPGIGRCKLHGGSTGSHVKAAQKVQAERVLRSVWNPNAAPVTDSVGALQRLAGGLEDAVGILGAQLTVGEPCEACGRGDVALDPVNAGAWTRTVRELRTALSDMERLGLAQRVMELEKRKVDVVVGMLLRALETPGAGLGPEVRGLVLEAFVGEVRAARGEPLEGEGAARRLNELDAAVEAILAARLARVEAEGVNKGVRLAAQLVKDHALGENTTPGQVVTFLLARADRAALRSDAHAEQKGEQP
jgi:hypothetical protein